jgi:hypothetical protein
MPPFMPGIIMSASPPVAPVVTASRVMNLIRAVPQPCLPPQQPPEAAVQGSVAGGGSEARSSPAALPASTASSMRAASASYSPRDREAPHSPSRRSIILAVKPGSISRGTPGRRNATQPGSMVAMPAAQVSSTLRSSGISIETSRGRSKLHRLVPKGLPCNLLSTCFRIPITALKHRCKPILILDMNSKLTKLATTPSGWSAWPANRAGSAGAPGSS